MCRIHRIPITKADALGQLDDDEIVRGYQDGRANEMEPGDNHSFSYWHGWNNGMVDGGHRNKSPAQAELAKDYLKRNPPNEQ